MREDRHLAHNARGRQGSARRMMDALETQPRLPWPKEDLDAGAPRPAILMLDSADHPLGQALAQRGMNVLRTTSPATALELVLARPPLLMVLIRMSDPALDPVRTIAALHERRPDLWIGMLGEGAGKEVLDAGYAAGAADLLQPGAPPEAIALRVFRSLPSPERLREQAHRRRLEKNRERQEAPLGLRTAPRKVRRLAFLLGFAATLGIAGAILWQSALGIWDRLGAGVDRIFVAIDKAPEVPDRVGRALDRIYRAEELQFKKTSWEVERLFREREIEETKYRDLFRNASPPGGPEPASGLRGGPQVGRSP